MSVEPERDAGEESDLGVGGFDEPLREAGVKCDIDRCAVRADPALQLNERGDPGSAGPACPFVERDLAVVAFDREDVTQSFFEEVRAPRARVGFGDPVELVALAASEITGVLPQRVARFGDVLRVAGRASLPCEAETASGATTFGLIPGPAAFDIERFDRPGDNVERIGAANEGVRSFVYEALQLRQAELASGGSVCDGRDPPGVAR